MITKWISIGWVFLLLQATLFASYIEFPSSLYKTTPTLTSGMSEVSQQVYANSSGAYTDHWFIIKSPNNLASKTTPTFSFTKNNSNKLATYYYPITKVETFQTTKEEFVPSWGISTIDHTRLTYDEKGSYAQDGGTYLQRITTPFGTQDKYNPDISACSVISSSGTYTLTADITDTAADCIDITAENVILDCAGHWINNAGNGIKFGSTAHNGQANNCNLNVSGSNNNGLRIEANNVSANNNTYKSVSYTDAYMWNNLNSTLTNSTFYGSAYALIYYNSQNSTVSNATVSGCTNWFYSAGDDTGSLIEHFTISDNPTSTFSGSGITVQNTTGDFSFGTSLGSNNEIRFNNFSSTAIQRSYSGWKVHDNTYVLTGSAIFQVDGVGGHFYNNRGTATRPLVVLGQDALIYGNNLTASEIGMYFNGNDGNNSVFNNQINSSGLYGVILFNTRTNPSVMEYVYNNTFRSTHATAAAIGDYSTSTNVNYTFYNNTIITSNAAQYCINLNSNSKDKIFYNNTFTCDKWVDDDGVNYYNYSTIGNNWKWLNGTSAYIQNGTWTGQPFATSGYVNATSYPTEWNVLGTDFHPYNGEAPPAPTDANYTNITAIAVQPSSPTILTDLSCNITEIGTFPSYDVNYSWFKNGTNQTGLAGTYNGILNNTPTIISTIQKGNLSFGENWSCAAIGWNGTNTTSLNYSANVSVANNANPIVASIAAYPASPTIGTDIYCKATITDDFFAQTNLTIEWYKNGANQTGLASTYTNLPNNTDTTLSTVQKGNLSYGENWSCKIRAYDGYNYSTYNFSANITIGANSAPSVVGVNILPASPNTADTLAAYVNATDDFNSTLEIFYEWYYNGTINATGSFAPFANASNVSVASLLMNASTIGNWSINITASDGLLNSTSVMSANITVSSASLDVNISYPANASFFGPAQCWLLVQTNTTGYANGTTTCRVYYANSSLLSSKSSAYILNTTTSFNFTFGNYTQTDYYVNCTSTAGTVDAYSQDINVTMSGLSFCAAAAPTTTSIGGNSYLMMVGALFGGIWLGALYIIYKSDAKPYKE